MLIRKAFILWVILMSILILTQSISAQDLDNNDYDNDIEDNEDDNGDDDNGDDDNGDDEDEFAEVYEEIEEQDINIEDLTLIEQIQLGYYDSVLDKYIKQLKAKQSTPAYQSDASYAISQIMYLEDDADPVTELINALNNVDPLGENNYIRRYAALALGYIDDPRVIRPLVNAMKFKYLEISKENQIEPDYEKSYRTNQAIFKNRVEEDLYVRLYACYSLGKLRADEAAREMINILKKNDEPSILRRQAALSLGRILNPSVYNNIVDELEDVNNDKLVLKNIIWTLGQYGKLGYDDNSVLRILLSIIYNDRTDVVPQTYISLENLMNTGNNDQTDDIIDEIIDSLNLAISSDIYREYLNLMYNPRTNVDIKEIINEFIDGLKEIKDAVSSSNLLNDISIFLNKIENPDDFIFPKQLILLEEYDTIMNQLKNMKYYLDSIEISSARRDTLIQLFDNASKALNLLSDNEEAQQQALVYEEAKNALERYVVVKEGEISLIEPIGYLTDLRNRYNKAINAMNDFYNDYARREAVLSLGKIYQYTYETYKTIERYIEENIEKMTLSLRSIMSDRKIIYKSVKNLKSQEYLNYFTEISETSDNIASIIESYLYTSSDVVDTLNNLVFNYYTDDIHNPKEIIADKIEERTIYSKDYSYDKETIRKTYTQSNTQQTISKQDIIESYNGNSSFIEFLGNRFTNFNQVEEDKKVLVIFAKGEEDEEVKEIVGIITQENIIQNEEEEVIDLEGDTITIETYRRGTQDVFINDIQEINWYRIPKELIGKNVRINDNENNLYIGLLESIIYDEVGKKVVIENNSGEIFEIYIENIMSIYHYFLPTDILNKKVIVNYSIDTGEQTEAIGKIIDIQIDENGKKAIIEIPSRQIDIYLHKINGIVIIKTIENYIGKKVIIKIGNQNDNESDNTLDTGPYYVYGILVDEQLDRVIIKTVDFDGDVYNISKYFEPIFMTHISEIIIDYSIPDMLTLGPKSIEIPGLWNKLKYQKDSLMERYEQSYQKLRDLSDPKRKFSEISKIIQNAIESLQFFKDNSEIAKLYIETLKDVLNSIDNINKYIEENAQNLLFIKNLIRDNVYETQFELSRVKQSNNDNEDNDRMVSALNNILFDTFQNDRDKFVRINSISSLIDIDYKSYVSDMVNTLKNPAEPISLRAFVFNILKTYGFPAYMQYSKEDLQKEKYRAIKIKLQEMYEALENYQNIIYEIASSALEVPDIYKDPNFSKNHYLRVLAVLSLGEFPTGESIELLISIVKTYYPYKLRHSNYNVTHKRLTNKLRKYALDTLVNKNNLNRGFVRSIEILLFNIIRNTEETIKIRTAASKGVGKLAIRARQITEETGKRLVIRPELIDVLLLSLITPNTDFRCAIVWSLGELGAEKSVDYLRSLIIQDYIDLEVKKSCLFALYKIRTEEAIDIIKNALYSQEEELENLARDLLKKLGLR